VILQTKYTCEDHAPGLTLSASCFLFLLGVHASCLSMVTMVTMGSGLQPGCLADRLLTGLGQPQINP
jgi:hypothetical protein